MLGTQTSRFSGKVPQLSSTPKSGSIDCSLSTFRAESYLRRLGAFEVIADIYDDDEMLRGALHATIKDFEYPDWSHKTIGDVLKQFYPK